MLIKLNALSRLNAHTKDELWIPGIRGYHYAVGCLLLAADTLRFSFQLRSPRCDTPNTYGCWGGSLNSGEEVFPALLRELYEETGYKGRTKIFPLMIHKDLIKSFWYYNTLVLIPNEFKIQENKESAGNVWVNYGDWPTPLHSGLISLLKDKASIKTVKSVIQSVKRADYEGQDPLSVSIG